jgi:MarR-like DNA-binding transcriptional regulator SgrR of sgrS sRNA
MRWGVNITTRRWRHKSYEKSFLGNEAVDWLMKTLNVDRQQATRLGQILLDRSIFHHVTFSDTFADKPALYRFFQVSFKYLEN